MDRLLGALQQLQVAVTEIPRPPAGTPNKSFSSPLTRGRRSGSNAAVAITTGGTAVATTSIYDVLVPSNRGGHDDGGYFVPSRITAEEMVRDFFGIPLGFVKSDGSIQWHEAAKWRQLSRQFDLSQVSRNHEGKNFMRLVVYIATEEELAKMAAPAPGDPIALAACLNAKRTATDDVIGRLMVYLQEHETLLDPTPVPKKKGAPKKNTVGALYKRWERIKFPLRVPKPPVISNNILHWSDVSMPATASSASASASAYAHPVDSVVYSASSSTVSKKRRRGTGATS